MNRRKFLSTVMKGISGVAIGIKSFRQKAKTENIKQPGLHPGFSESSGDCYKQFRAKDRLFVGDSCSLDDNRFLILAENTSKSIDYEETTLETLDPKQQSIGNDMSRRAQEMGEAAAKSRDKIFCDLILPIKTI